MNVFAIRHGETAWSLSGQHTGATDIPLTDNGRRLAALLRPVLAMEGGSRSSSRALAARPGTCGLAGLGDRAAVDPDLVEGGSTADTGADAQSDSTGGPRLADLRMDVRDGKHQDQVGAPVDWAISRASARPRATSPCSRTANVLRVLAARWLGLPAGAGQHFMLDTGTLSVLGYYRGIPAVKVWNGPLVA